MIPRRRHAKYPHAPAAAGGDTDALHTDVMRFMSIIGLCLMAVFALVQGLPQQEKAKSTASAQAARLRGEIRAQQLQVGELQAALHAMKAEMLQARAALALSRQDLERAAGETEAARRARGRLELRVADLERQLARERDALAGIEQSSRRKAQDLAELRGRLLQTQVELDRSQAELEKLRRESRRPAKPPPIEARPVPPVPAPRPVPERQGFTLQFVSGEALDRLVEAGSVTLYAMAGKQAWRLSMEAGRPAVARATHPRWFHEMSTLTVPVHYLHSLAKAADGPGGGDVVWGVQLPRETRDTIAALTRDRAGGELVIRGDGRVELRE